MAIAAAAALLILFVHATHRVLVWVMIALFLALALDHVVAPLERRLPRPPATLIVIFAALVAAAGIGFLLVPTLIEQVQALIHEIPDLVRRLQSGRGPLGSLADRFHVVERVRDAVSQAGAGALLGLTGSVLNLVTVVATTLIGVLAVVFLTLFMLLRGSAWWRAFVAFVPERHQALWESLGRHVYHAIGGWVIGAFFIALIAGTSAGVVLFLLGSPYAIAIGVIVGLLDPIPFIGATLAGLIGVLLTLATNGFTDAVIFAGFVLAYQQVVENHVLIPLIYGRTVQLDSLGVLLAVLIGAELGGIIGAIVAIPIGGAIKAITGELIRWRRGVPAEQDLAATGDEAAPA